MLSSVECLGALVDAPQEHMAEVHRPPAIFGFLRADGMVGQRVTQEENAFLKPEGPGPGDRADQEMAAVLDRRERIGKGAWRTPIARAGGGALQRGMGPFFILEGAELIERPLLRTQ